jgi:starch-binding outer membrane protein, SusD/RagB family
MKDLIKYTLISALFIGAVSCNDLDEEIKGDFTKDFDPANQGVGIKNNVNKASPNDGLSDAFSRLLPGTATNGGFFQVQELSSDEVVITQKGGDWFDGGDYIRMHRHEFSPQTVSINDAWSQAYNGIFQCNDLLDDAGLTAANTAQLRTLRAYFYWRLMDLFGNVKIVTTAGGDAPQSQRPQVFNFIESELLASIPDLPTTRAEYGRVNQFAAYALLSRLYLNAHIYTGGAPRYQDAVDAADEVINSGLYSLSPEYKDVFSPDNVDNIEHIFVATFDEATGEGMTIAQMTLHYPSQLTFRLAEQPWNGYAAMEEFYNSYEDTDDRKANNFIVGPQLDQNGNPVLDLAFDKADPDGPPVNYTPFINEMFPNSSRQGGARLGKFSFKVPQNSNMDNDYPLLRYGEVLLNKAEAVARLNGNNFSHPTTLGLVNEIRIRAGVDEFLTMTEGQMLAERGRELFIEALRRTDLIRFGAWGNAWWEKPAHSDAHKILFPIPLQQMQATASTANPLTQNPGY